MKRFAGIVLAGCLMAGGCNTLQQMAEVGTAMSVAAGAISPEEAQSINRTVSAAAKALESITPEQEYYIGRTVAATILSRNRPLDNPSATEYLNEIGHYLALCSARPETFAGYHFLIMDTDEINAFAAPGGFILVSRGMLRCCRNEDEVAAVLAHEIGHIEHQHGLQAINKSRITAAATVLAAESARTFGSKEFVELVRNFEDSVTDVVSTLVDSGYSRTFESQADAAAVATLERAGYDPRGLLAMLAEMDVRLKRGGSGFAKTHPDPKIRGAEVRALISATASPASSVARAQRFASALRGM
jgi:predicted Zn-dependent protease